MTTREKALKKLMSKRRWYDGTGIKEQDAWNYKGYLEKGLLTIEKQREILLACGYKLAQEEMWIASAEKKKG